MNEEAQVTQLQAEYDDWINLRNSNAMDDELFDEFQARANMTLATLEETQGRLAITRSKFDVEDALMTTRNNDETARLEL
jgi:hypothetical protein